MSFSAHLQVMHGSRVEADGQHHSHLILILCILSVAIACGEQRPRSMIRECTALGRKAAEKGGLSFKERMRGVYPDGWFWSIITDTGLDLPSVDKPRMKHL